MSKHPWQVLMEAGQLDNVVKLFAPNVVFHSPIVSKPFHGAKLVSALVPLLRDSFSDVVYTADLAGERMRALVCNVKIAGLEGENMQLLRFDEEGRIVDITVMLRPFRVAEALNKAISSKVMLLPDGSYTVKGLN